MNATHCHDGNTSRDVHHTHTFDAPAWFAAWSDNGGIAMLIGDRLFVSRLACLDTSAARQLDRLRPSVHTPGAGEALAGLLRANSGMNGEAHA